MKEVDIRKMVIKKFRRELQNNHRFNNIDVVTVESEFFIKKIGPKKIVSSKTYILAQRIYGVNYKMVSDDGSFQYTNNIRALALAIFQIVFQDPYIASLIISQLNQNMDYITRVKNFPLQGICTPEQYPAVIFHTIRQLCFLCEQNLQTAVRDILSAYYLGLEMMGLILRGILMKLNYPGAIDYNNVESQKNTVEIFTIICQYLDINLVSRRPDLKTLKKTQIPQFYFFPEQELFILSPDNSEFICGTYFQTKQQMKISKYKTTHKIKIPMGRSYCFDERYLKGEIISKNQLKNSTQFSMLDLRTSESDELALLQTSYHSTNNPVTPEFCLHAEDAKWRWGQEKSSPQSNWHVIDPILQAQQCDQRNKNKGKNGFFGLLETHNEGYFTSNVQSITVDQDCKQKELVNNFNLQVSQIPFDFEFLPQDEVKRKVPEDNYGSDQSEIFSQHINDDFEVYSPIQELLRLNISNQKNAHDTPLITARQLLHQMQQPSRQALPKEEHPCVFKKEQTIFQSTAKQSSLIKKQCFEKNEDKNSKVNYLIRWLTKNNGSMHDRASLSVHRNKSMCPEKSVDERSQKYRKTVRQSYKKVLGMSLQKKCLRTEPHSKQHKKIKTKRCKSPKIKNRPFAEIIKATQNVQDISKDKSVKKHTKSGLKNCLPTKRQPQTKQAEEKKMSIKRGLPQFLKNKMENQKKISQVKPTQDGFKIPTSNKLQMASNYTLSNMKDDYFGKIKRQISQVSDRSLVKKSDKSSSKPFIFLKNTPSLTPKATTKNVIPKHLVYSQIGQNVIGTKSSKNLKDKQSTSTQEEMLQRMMFVTSQVSEFPPRNSNYVPKKQGFQIDKYKQIIENNKKVLSPSKQGIKFAISAATPHMSSKLSIKQPQLVIKKVNTVAQKPRKSTNTLVSHRCSTKQTK